MNYQKKIVIITGFDKKTTERSKKEEMNRKKPEIN